MRTLAVLWTPFAMGILLLFAHLLQVSAQSDTSGPVFIQEPPNQMDFSNTTGTEIICQSRGTPMPQITWVKTDGSIVQDVPGLRKVLSNGNLVLPPFRAEDYNQEVHAQTYRCIAENSLGKIQSRDVQVRAVVVNQNYEVDVFKETVILGNDALLKCAIPSFVADLLTVQSWIDSLGVTIGAQSHPNDGDGKYVVLPSGELQIRNVTADDGFKTYKCRTKHRLTGETKLSATAGKLVITEPVGSSAPKVPKESKSNTFSVAQGISQSLLCPAQGSPLPSWRWYKFMKSNNNKKLVDLDDRVKQVGGTLIIKEATVDDSGKYLCMVNNSVGGESVETVLTVTAPLSVEVEPKQQIVDYGRPATFKCNYKGNPVKSIYWLKNGEPIDHTETTLRIASVKKEDRGMYQCFVRNDQESAQATGELKLGGRFDPPEFVYAFDSITTQPGPMVSLKCVAKGDPAPEVKWFSYNNEVESDGVLLTGSFQADNGDVVSYLNISQVRTKYGGSYECQASSKVGSVRHSAKLNVNGAPYVRKMRPMKVVAGKSMFVTCPVAGHPISSVSWEKDGRQLPFNDRQTVFPNGTLAIANVQRKEDASTYTCVARNDEGYSARSDLTVTVMEPPEILAFDFGKDIMDEGDFIHVSCIVTKGDLPLSIRWSFHGHTVGAESGISTSQAGPRANFLSIPSVSHKHRGLYTCTATNEAGNTSVTTQLKVNVSPRWTVEPTDKQFAQGSDAKIDCKADGFPKPEITWKKAVVTNPQMRPTPNDYNDFDASQDRNIKIIEGALIIKNIKKANEGFYLCKASNGIGGISAVAKIAVQAPPSFEIKKRTQTALISENTVLQCEAKGEKPIGVLWNMNNKRLDTNVDPRYTIREESQEDGMLSTISIKRTQREDSALFTCVATNAFGSDDTSINLIIQEKPETPYGLKVLDKTGRTVKLSWQAPYNGNSNLTRYIIEFKPIKGTWANDIDHVLVPGDQTMAGVFSLRPATSYHFRIVAQNEIGVSGPSDTVTIETAQEAPSGSPVDIRLAAVDQHTLRVSWKPPLSEHWNGDILGYYVGYKKTSYGEDKPYLFETVEFIKEQGHEHQLQISNLEVFTEYAVVVQAFNKMGQGPMSEEVLVHTAEGAPTQPPEGVILTTLSSQSIKVTWSAPPRASTNGVIKGYKVIYGPSKTWYDPATRNTKISSDAKTELTGLKKFTNYTVQVLAFTNGGDGVKSDILTSTTEQDIPGPPSSVKALAMSDEAILVSWQEPEEPNGKVIQYTVYIKELDRSRDMAPKSHKVNALQMSHQVDSLNRKARYEFWVTAHTTIGEGSQSSQVTLSPTNRIPAKIASFDDAFVAVAKQDLKLPCIAVGSPSPELHWKMRGQPIPENDRIRQLPDGSLQITRVIKEDSGKYTCMVNNKYGQDMVTHELIVNGPPDPPEVTITSQTTDTITVKLRSANPKDMTPVHGYTLHYKPEFGDWNSAQIPFGSDEFTLNSLNCGQLYHLYITAYNSIGVGPKSAQLTANTKGVKPTIPEAHQFLEVSAGSVTLHLNAWLDGGCPIINFVVEYKPKNQMDWTLVSNNVKAGGNFVVLDLNPATWYNLRVTAKNNAGYSVAEYEIATLTVTGGTIAPVRKIDGSGSDGSGQSPFEESIMYFLTNVNLVVPVVSAIAVIVIAIAVICVLRSGRREFPKEEYAQYYGQMNTNGRMMTMKHDGLPYEEMGYCPPPNRKLPPVPGQHSNYNTIDRIKNGHKNKASAYATYDRRASKNGGQLPGEGPQYDEIPYGDVGPNFSGKGKLPQVPDDYSQVPQIPARQVGGSIANGEEDISPYATFHLLGMREENKGNPNPNAAGVTAANFQTLPPGAGMGPNGPNTPSRHISQTMNPRRSLANPPPGVPMQTAVYDSVNCDYEPGSMLYQSQPQNFGNPYDCPEGMYGGSMVSSVGYSKVSDHMGGPAAHFNPNGNMPARGGMMPPQPHFPQQQLPQPPHHAAGHNQINQAMQQSYPGDTGTVIFKGGPNNGAARGPLPNHPDEEHFPPPPPMRGGAAGGSVDTSLNDSNSTTQSNLTSECSEAECDREPLVKGNQAGNRASVASEKELSNDEMRRLLERNEVVNTNGGANINPNNPYDSVNV